jgi:hypothetical protein
VAGGLVTAGDGDAGRYAGHPVQDQLDAYNRGDLDAFLLCYTPDAVVSDGTGAVVMAGREQMRERYGRRLASPGLHCTLVQRMAAGDWFVDQEHLTGFDGGDADALVAYRVDRTNRIERVRR